MNCSMRDADSAPSNGFEAPGATRTTSGSSIAGNRARDEVGDHDIVPLEIRPERPADLAAIRDVNRRAFGQDDEGAIVDALRSHGAASLSLVATIDERVVGHIMYSPVELAGISGAGLGPMAVLPEHQREGIGSRLVETGNERLRHAGCPFVVVLGHAGFYPRFGFKPARPLGIRCEWDVPDDVFLILLFEPARMRAVSGLAKYGPEFAAAG
jgi:putative acetyltransferase